MVSRGGGQKYSVHTKKAICLGDMTQNALVAKKIKKITRYTM